MVTIITPENWHNGDVIYTAPDDYYQIDAEYLRVQEALTIGRNGVTIDGRRSRGRQIRYRLDSDGKVYKIKD